MRTLQELTSSIIEFRDARDWKQFHRPKDLALDLTIEAAEVAEHFLWREGADLDRQITERRTAIGEELADVLYCTLLMAHDCGIDIERAFIDKLAKNAAKYPIDRARGQCKKWDEL